ncbi:MAG: carbonic anhydrase [Vicinamibacterales bacterium]
MPTFRLVALALVVSSALAAAPADQASPTDPAEILALLKAGNERFVSNPGAAPRVDVASRAALVTGQHPMAIVVSCADSRVPPELVFNRGLGELFVIRVAGEVADQSVIASVEYAAEHLGTPLVIVMGHQFCGAVTAALDTAPGATAGSPSLDFLIGSIRPAFARTTSEVDAAHLRDLILANVEQVVNDLASKSTIVQHLHEAGKLALVGAYYELETGRVHFSTPFPAATAHEAR